MRLFLLSAALLCTAGPARAGTSLNLGADYVLNGGPGIFSLTLSADSAVSRSVFIGGRFGALVTSSPSSAGVPLDLYLRISPGRSGVYLEGLAGPWIFFSGDTVRAHGAFGFGLASRSVDIGGEVGWISGFSQAMLGVRLGFRI